MKTNHMKLGFKPWLLESASFGGDGKRRGIAPAARAAPPVPLSPCRWHLAYAFVCTRRHALVLCRLCVSTPSHGDGKRRWCWTFWRCFSERRPEEEVRRRRFGRGCTRVRAGCSGSADSSHSVVIGTEIGYLKVVSFTVPTRSPFEGHSGPSGWSKSKGVRGSTRNGFSWNL